MGARAAVVYGHAIRGFYWLLEKTKKKNRKKEKKRKKKRNMRRW